MNLLLRTCIAVVAITLMAGPAVGVTPEQRFVEAQAQFDLAKKKLAEADDDSIEARRGFHESATSLAALADEGIASVNLYVNTGNAYHFAGDNPRALLWYLRAEKLANTPETRSGLATLRRVCKTNLWPAEHASIGRAIMFWHYDLPRRFKQMLLLAVYPLGCLMVMVSLFIKRRSMWIRLGITLIVIGGIVGISDLVTATIPSDQWAVVLEETQGYAGDGQGYSVMVDSIVPSQEVKVIETRNHWIQIELPTGTQCWIHSRSCEKV